MSDSVLVAMSGGIDSSVICGLLREQGFDVAGATLYMFDDFKTGEECASCMKNCSDAHNVADQFGIPHTSVKVTENFKKYVVNNFVDSYINGLTPNPCVQCNKHIKFNEMLRIADSKGIKYIATGHYAKVCYDENSGRYLLKKANDPTKDQSYVLYSLSQEILSRTLFPLGSISKSQVREYAKEHEMAVLHKAESQDICFIPDGDYGAFLHDTLGVNSEPGNFTDKDGNVIGRHSGIINYTVGQRKGLGGGFSCPMFVISKDAKSNTVVLGKNEDLFSEELVVGDVNFISVPSLDKPMRADVKIRYSADAVPATIEPCADGKVKVSFDRPQRAITPGQSAVFYDGDIVIGGGIIQ